MYGYSLCLELFRDLLRDAETRQQEYEEIVLIFFLIHRSSISVFNDTVIYDNFLVDSC